MATSWRNDREAFVLARRSCPEGACAAVFKTADAGATWTELSLPNADVNTAPQGGGSSCTRTPCVRSIAVSATDDAVYLFGPSLLVSDDAGQSWRTEDGKTVIDLATTNDGPLRVSTGCDLKPTTQLCPDQVERRDATTGAWASSPTPELFGTSTRLSANALTAAVIGHDRLGNRIAIISSDAGRSWTDLPDRCPAAADGLTEATAAISVANDKVVAVLCGTGLGARPTAGSRNDVVLSHDGGVTFGSPHELPPIGSPPQQGATQIGAQATHLAVIQNGAVQVSNNDGAVWTTPLAVNVDASSDASLVRVGSVGFAATLNGTLYVSTDGGMTWTARTPG